MFIDVMLIGVKAHSVSHVLEYIFVQSPEIIRPTQPSDYVTVPSQKTTALVEHIMAASSL